MDYFEMLKDKSRDIKNLKTKILGVEGSPRAGGNSDSMLRHALKGIEEDGVETTKLHLRDLSFQGCVGCERCRKDKVCTKLHDGMSLIYPEVIESKGLLLVSPTHNYNITAWMKAFIDRLYCFYNFDNNSPRGWSSRLSGQGRKAVIVAVCEQENKKDMGFTLEAMRMPLEALGYEIVEEVAVFKIFEKGGVKKSEDIMAEIYDAGKKLAEAISF